MLRFRDIRSRALSRLKNLSEFAQGLHARYCALGYPHFAASRNVQHPERHFQSPTSLDLFQAAVGHCQAPLYEARMHPHCPAMPWMPGIADFSEIPNMRVVLLSCITKKATINARTTCCSSLPLLGLSPVGDVASAVENVSATNSDTTVAPHEYFDQTP
jgi:hypothetical protein